MKQISKIQRLMTLIQENELKGTKMHSEMEESSMEETKVSETSEMVEKDEMSTMNEGTSELVKMIKSEISKMMKEKMNESYDDSKREKLSKEIDEEIAKFVQVLNRLMKTITPAEEKKKEVKKEEIDLDDLD